ncbi:hypothetical protein FDK11_09600, partial [Campylobacter upsaliensis]|nr:hypothetical protein [Campylobacter upsaliensis]
MYDFSKYENATPKQIVNALILVEKRAEKLALQTKENNELFKFLNQKLKSSFKANRIPELDEAIKEYENGEVEYYSSVEEAFRAL